MKIFYAGVEHDSYDPHRGRSFEYRNFYCGLKNMPGVEVVSIPFERILEVGRTRFNHELVERVKKEKPDLFFVFMFSDELKTETLAQLRTLTTTLAWFADDSWRFYNYSRRYAKYFSWVVTTYSWMPEKYHAIGQPQVVRSQWGIDPALYKPSSVSSALDVAFVGGWTKPREDFMSELRKQGIAVSAFGAGWPAGKVSDERMLEIFSTAKINIGLNTPPGYWNKNSLGRLFARHSANKIVPDFHLIQNIESFFHRGIPQIKARHFEIPACGGFLMTSRADDLDAFYEPGKELVLYQNASDAAEKIKYYLRHDEERQKIARAGYERTLRDHTYRKRFEEIFSIIAHNANRGT